MPDDALAARPHARASFVGGRERPLFLWHHPPAAQRRRAAAVVLCPAIGYEYMSAYRSWRLLAERLAARGFDVIRFDYDGTGNSSGCPEDPHRFDAWKRSVGAAIDEARRLAETDRIALVGLRAGSLLALQAAAAWGGVERLALWSPFPSGRAYVRELKAIASLNEQGEEAEGAGINVEGHLITDETVNSFVRWSLAGITRRPAPHVILLERDDRRADGAVDAHLRALGCRVDRLSVAGTAEMLLPPHLAKVPEHALETLVNWFDPWHESSTSEQSHASVERVPALALDAYDNEQPVHFGPDQRLFGIMTRPAADRAAAPSIVLLNTGAGHHVGPHRLYVPLAREWAAEGHLVFRFDLGGIGDSAAPHGAEGGDAYPGHMIDDAREAIALVRQEAPDRPVMLVGLCSGGWLAFEAARSGLPVGAIISINPPLYLRDGDRGWVRQQRQIDRYHRSIRDPMKWLKALRSATTTAAVVRTIARRAGRHATTRLRRLTGDRLPAGLANDLQLIAGNHIATFFVFSDGDNGHRYFEQHAPPALQRPDVRQFVQHVVVDDAGHVFRPMAAQRRLKSLLNELVSRLTAPVERANAQNATWARRPV